MTDTSRPGSMAAAENKTTKYMKIGMTVATVILIVLLFTVPLLKKEASQTGGFFKVLSVIGFIVAFGAIATENYFRNSIPEYTFYFVWFIGMGLGFFLAICGGI